ncbi:hypothetical protein TREMEDRAFT_62279 [Tremella mesenterica DSM 1558]|uniref:uncharacterized protein n=1 Tax=Tremella mesenterica (strain ATCC 24925 / CBS 8224 / DSM 1558 / NBRC 9311 / NRRL Y-6157 / RJB 2259-6 / UBC 559-6) TaxID=578456 RepID=UPI0003F4A039|nr:uncharacterized protein TREMEDRAFT_62279 [Tremella mesenterica DSM 1558]EIW69413.1 hypothetical protein TREMEDRAFT_62279 [Tremella mesenterica DSM 1558]
MKYLIDYLGTLPDAPDLQDPDFQQLLVDVQAGKSQTKSADAFYEGLEKAVNELKSAQQSFAFQKPVSKRDAPDYYEIIKRPMDLTTVLRNIKTHKYKNKADFATDLDLIWENCLTYNTTESHPLRAAARFMRQKTDHLLQFVADKNDRSAQVLPVPSAGPSSSRPSLRNAGSSAPYAVPPSPQQNILNGPGVTKEVNGPGRGDSGDGRGTSNASVGGVPDRRTNGAFLGTSFQNPPPYRINLSTSLNTTPALIRTPQMSYPFHSLVQQPAAGPSSYLEKGKMRELLNTTPAPSWYPPVEGDDLKLQGSWWGLAGRDECYVSTLPAVPFMAPSQAPPTRCIPSRSKRKRNTPMGMDTSPDRPPSLVPSKSVKLENLIQQRVDKLFESRKIVNAVSEFQRMELEGVIPPRLRFDDGIERNQRRRDRLERKQKMHEERIEAKKRRRLGGEVGEKEAVLGMRSVSARMLAHAGFEGANEGALDLFTRVAINHLSNVGRTFRLLIDGFSQKMSSEEIILHALHENGQIETSDLEAHIKDDIERDRVKVIEMARKLRQAYKEVTTAPVIEDDMMFADNGEMLLDGNFAEELGEDFLGLRDLGIDKEYGMQSLTVPSSVFYGRRKRDADASGLGSKIHQPDFPPPPPFIPLSTTTLHIQLPGLLHAFFATRIESGIGLVDDQGFDVQHSQIGMLGQVIVKNPPPVKKKVVEEKEKKEKPPKKPVQSGVGKGNWIRPSKEERARRAAEKAGLPYHNGDGSTLTPTAENGTDMDKNESGMDMDRNGSDGRNGLNGAVSEDAEGEEEDAVGEEE